LENDYKGNRYVMQQQKASISDINPIYETIPCNGKAMSKAMERE
jgi:hypothetical protein